MSSLRPSPAMASYVTDRIDSVETYQAIQEKRDSGFRLKGVMTLPDGRMNLIFHYEKKSGDSLIYLAFRNSRARSFSSHQ